MQTMLAAYPELNLNCVGLLEKVSEEKPEEVGAATSNIAQGTVNRNILAHSALICQEAILRGVANWKGMWQAP